MIAEPEKHLGKLECFNHFFAKGWAANCSAPELPTIVQVFEGDTLIEQIIPSLYRFDLENRGDLGTGCHGFVFEIPRDLFDGGLHQLHFRFAETGEELEGSPVEICLLDETQYMPLSLSDLSGHKVLVLSPHPDDESLACGGSLILHSQKGDPVKIVFLTDGSKRDTRSEHEISEYIALRQNEAKLAASVLDVIDLEFWEVADRTLSPDEDAVDRLCKIVQGYRPTLIYAPSPMETHPDHRAAAAIVWACVQKLRFDTKLAFYDTTRPIAVNTLVNITEVADRKRQACNSYESQLRYHPYSDCSLALNRFRALAVSANCEYAEGFLLIDSSEIFDRRIESVVLQQVMPRTHTPIETSPLVSVLIRTKNRPLLLRQALSSVLTQRYSNLEVIVINDGGEDVSAIINEFAPFLTIKYQSHDEQRGRSAAANSAALLASGKFVNLLDDDDILYPDHIAKLAQFLEMTGEEFAYSDCELARLKWGEKGHPEITEKSLFMGYDFDQEQLYTANFIPLMTAMFTLDLLRRTGPFDQSLEIAEDWDMWIRMSEKTMLHRLPGVTAQYRIFANHGYNTHLGTARIYAKHIHHWTPERLALTAWPRIDALRQENQKLKQHCARLEDQLKNTAAPSPAPVPSNDQHLWQIRKTKAVPSANFPGKVKSLVRVCVELLNETKHKES